MALVVTVTSGAQGSEEGTGVACKGSRGSTSVRKLKFVTSGCQQGTRL